MKVKVFVAQSCLTLCDPMNRSTPGLPVHHHLSGGEGGRGAKYWSFGFSPSNEYSGLISFRIDWIDLLAVQGTLRSLLQHNSSKACELLVVAYGI